MLSRFGPLPEIGKSVCHWLGRLALASQRTQSEGCRQAGSATQSETSVKGCRRACPGPRVRGRSGGQRRRTAGGGDAGGHEGRRVIAGTRLWGRHNLAGSGRTTQPGGCACSSQQAPLFAGGLEGARARARAGCYGPTRAVQGERSRKLVICVGERGGGFCVCVCCYVGLCVHSKITLPILSPVFY